MSEPPHIPEELIKIKAHQISEKKTPIEKKGYSQSDWDEAKNYFKNRPWEVAFWKLKQQIISKKTKKRKHYTSQTSKETLRRCGKYIPLNKSKPSKVNKSKPSKISYVQLEKHVLEPLDAWIEQQAFISILGRLGNLALIVAVVSFVFGQDVRRNNEVFSAWQTITSAEKQSGSGGRIEALQFLNSRPLKFPWIGFTKKKEWFWHKGEQECKHRRMRGARWERQPLVGLLAPNAYLIGINLCEPILGEAVLEKAHIEFSVLKKAYLWNTNLREAKLIETDLQNATFVKAVLQETILAKADLQGGYLEKVDLEKAILWKANLKGVYLWDANLKGAILWGANLEGAYLIETKNLTPKQIKSACFWDKAIYKSEVKASGNFNELYKLKELERSFNPLKTENDKFIEDLKNDPTSDPKKRPNCNHWETSK